MAKHYYSTHTSPEQTCRQAVASLSTTDIDEEMRLWRARVLVERLATVLEEVGYFWEVMTREGMAFQSLAEFEVSALPQFVNIAQEGVAELLDLLNDNIAGETARDADTLAPAATRVVRAAPEKEDPVMPVYREWCAARLEWKRYSHLPGNENFDRPESLAAQERESAAFWSLVNDLVPTSQAGVGALAHALWSIAGPSLVCDPDSEVEYDDPKERLMIKIWQATSGAMAPEPDRHLS